ncbi:ABC-type dipeptide/oligopeptide/nickel transport system, permease component [Deinococcus reticulitermitis]|uniref:ABC-type dipeptide/oligopeptide/nickel transport system, permease component n=1 Tax=Deinococcus reticulitermitis TaxID=856736 RepID=A0A1H6Z420_9DEIO|nr:hypothetical protein [Deinococcus reticulitermitis]SEJ48181.1 ABC-type dipeptide/oligopeptide/nickel transport system, permease component [Deinococcus reticulitermitis]
MRFLLLPLLLLALLAPRQECPVRPVVAASGAAVDPADLSGVEGELLFPPLRAGQPAAPFGTDRGGRDSGCLNARGLARSLRLSLGVVTLGFLPGLVLGLALAWRRRSLPLTGETLLLVATVLLLGPGAFRVALVLGVLLLTARLVTVRMSSVMREPFLEGALALGGRGRHILRIHLWPHLRPSLPAMLAAAFSAVFLWLMELGALGFHDQPVVQLAFSDSFDRVQDIEQLLQNADLGQLITQARWTWLDTPEQLVWPILLLTLLTLSLKDLARWAFDRVELAERRRTLRRAAAEDVLT